MKKKQHTPVIIIVNNNNKLNINELVKYSRKSYRKANQTPAATNVEECTKELTGVGARIASNNQLIKGNPALFVNITKKNNIRLNIAILLLYTQREIRKNKHTSPKREETKVIIEERRLRYFL